MNEIDCPERFDELDPARQDELLCWISQNVAPWSRGYRRAGTSYGLKHDAERELNYITNGEMKGAMLAAGYKPLDPSVQNCKWSIRLVGKAMYG